MKDILVRIIVFVLAYSIFTMDTPIRIEEQFLFSLLFTLFVSFFLKMTRRLRYIRIIRREFLNDDSILDAFIKNHLYEIKKDKMLVFVILKRCVETGMIKKYLYYRHLFYNVTFNKKKNEIIIGWDAIIKFILGYDLKKIGEPYNSKFPITLYFLKNMFRYSPEEVIVFFDNCTVTSKTELFIIQTIRRVVCPILENDSDIRSRSDETSDFPDELMEYQTQIYECIKKNIGIASYEKK